MFSCFMFDAPYTYILYGTIFLYDIVLYPIKCFSITQKCFPQVSKAGTAKEMSYFKVHSSTTSTSCTMKSVIETASLEPLCLRTALWAGLCFSLVFPCLHFLSLPPPCPHMHSLYSRLLNRLATCNQRKIHICFSLHQAYILLLFCSIF